MNQIINHHRQVWQQKKLLREIYYGWYQKIIKDLIPGKTVELGSGSGNFKEYKPDIISSDINPQPWLDMTFDAHQMPFKNGELSNVIMIDVFHHLQNPLNFLNEAHRVLKREGRIIMLEPFPSPFSLFIYRRFHPEPFIFNIDYFSKNFKSQNKTPWESNQAIPYLFFFKHRTKFENIFNKKLKIIKSEKLSFLLYPLSGGFENKQLIPNCFIPIIALAEKLLIPLKNFLAFRYYITLEKIN